MRLKKPLSLNCPQCHLQSYTWSSVAAECMDDRFFAGTCICEPTSLNNVEEGRMVEAPTLEVVSIKTPRGRQRENTSYSFPELMSMTKIKKADSRKRHSIEQS